MHSDSDRNFASFPPVSGSDFDVATGEMRASLPDRSLEREWRVLPGAVSDALVPERLELVDGCRKFVRLGRTRSAGGALGVGSRRNCEALGEAESP